MAGSASWQEQDNSYRCCKLTVDGFGYFSKQLLLQETVNNGLFNNVDAFLATKKNKIRILKATKIITDKQYFLMFPQNGTPTRLKEWDITLVFSILTNFVTLNRGQKNAIRNVRELRNTVFGHTVHMAMTETIFETTWANISSTLSRLSLLLTDQQCQTAIADMINSIEHEALSSDTVMKLMMEWYDSDKKVEERISEISSVKLMLKHIEGERERDNARVENRLTLIEPTKKNSLIRQLFYHDDLRKRKEESTPRYDPTEDTPVSADESRENITPEISLQKPSIRAYKDPEERTSGYDPTEDNPVSADESKALITAVTDLQRRYPEPKFSEHRDIACFNVVFEVEGTSKEIVDAVEEFVQNAMEVNVVDENEIIVKIVSQIMETFLRYEIRIVNIRRGSILKSQCLSIKGLRYTINTVNEESTSGYDPNEDTPVSADESRENITPELSLQKTYIRTDKDPGNAEVKPVDLESNASVGAVSDVGAVVKPEAIESNIMAYSDIKALEHKSKKEIYVKEIENICVQTKGLNSDIINVAASPNSSGDPEFVVISGNPETTEDKVKQSCPNLNDYLITFRCVSNEGRDVMYSDKCYNKHFTDLENTLIDKAIRGHTENIMGKFENVCAISACPVRSVGYGTCDAKIIEEVCILISVDVKFPNQRLPFGQEPLPKELDGLPVDVREGYVMAFGRKKADEFHGNVRMGCEIGSDTNMSGTLGAFVDLPDNKVGCLTSLHTILSESEMHQLYSGSSVLQQRTVMQPASNNRLLGHVINAHFFEGQQGSQPGMEVAVIEIDSNRCPVDGEFPYCIMENYGYEETNPISYNSGRVCSDSHLSDRKLLLNKYGAATFLTEGKFFRKGSPIKVFGRKFYDQIEIQDCQISCKDDKTNGMKKEIVPFAQRGDSGALVLAPFEGKKDDLRAVGLLGGCTSHGTYYVTPIAAILEQCELQCLKAFQQTNQPMEVDN